MSEGCCDDVPIDDRGAFRQFGMAGFAALWRHERVIAAELTEDPLVIPSQTQAGRVEIDDDGVLAAVHGLSTRSTRHRIEHHGGTNHTWCALDAIGIPAALAITADAVTSCPCCDVELRVHLDRGVPAQQANLVLWLPETSCEHLVNDFCSHANLYCSRAHLTDTVQVGADGRVITVEEVAEIGRHTWADVAEVPAR